MMPRSMTGFGRGESMTGERKFRVEIRAVNHRYFDFALKAPKFVYALESRIRKRLMKGISRGKVEAWVGFESLSGEDFSVSVNWPCAEARWRAIGELCERFGLEKPGLSMLEALLGAPDVLSHQKPAADGEADDEAVWQALGPALDGALGNLNAMREKEGESLCESIEENRRAAAEILCAVKRRHPAHVELALAALQARLDALGEKLGAGLGDERLLAEFAVLIDKSDISEELDRLDSHLAQLGAALRETGAVGRKIDFIVQEMNREANTIGSKSHSAEITGLAVELKSAIEKMREQAQNIE